MAELERDFPDEDIPEAVLNFAATDMSFGLVVIDGKPHLAVGDQAALDYRIDFTDDPENLGKYALVIRNDGSAIFYDFQGNETAKGDRLLHCERIPEDEAEEFVEGVEDES